MKNYQLQWKTEKGGKSVSWNIEQARSYDDDDDDDDDDKPSRKGISEKRLQGKNE